MYIRFTQTHIYMYIYQLTRKLWVQHYALMSVSPPSFLNGAYFFEES